VDNLVEGLYHAGVKPLRVGFGGKVRPSLLEHTLDYKLEEHPLKPNIDELSKKQEELQKYMENMRQKFDELKKRDNCSSQRPKRMQMSLISLERRLGVLNASLYARRQAMLRSIVGCLDTRNNLCSRYALHASHQLASHSMPSTFLLFSWTKHQCPPSQLR
jgi:hypothetical protein